MPLSAGGYDPDTLAMLYRVLDDAFHRAMSRGQACDEVEQQILREEIARALIRAYESGETDPELLSIIAMNSIQRGS